MGRERAGGIVGVDLDETAPSLSGRSAPRIEETAPSFAKRRPASVDETAPATSRRSPPPVDETRVGGGSAAFAATIEVAEIDEVEELEDLGPSGVGATRASQRGPVRRRRRDPNATLASIGGSGVAGVEIPRRIGRFAVLRRLGSGGMGTVYAAVADGPHGASDSEKVAIKVVRSDRSDDDGLARLRREADLLARLDHPALVRLRSTGVHEGQLFLVMDFVAGLQLDRWQSVTPRSWRQLLALYLHVGEGLAAAHALGVIHRDFKPANVLVDENDAPKIVDFGLARPLPALRAGSVGVEYSITATGRTSGTPGYTAPELFAGARADPAVDVFSFSVAALEALSRVEGEAAPGALIDVLLRGVAPDPRNRWADMPNLLRRMRTAAPEKGRGWFARLSSRK